MSLAQTIHALHRQNNGCPDRRDLDWPPGWPESGVL